MKLEELLEDQNSVNAFVRMHKNIEQLVREVRTPEAKAELEKWTAAVAQVKAKAPGNYIGDHLPDEVISRLLVIGETIVRTLSGTVSRA